MLYTDGNGFPLTIKPSHLYGSSERMDTAEVLSAIVEEACLYVPEASGATNVKKPKRLTEELEYLKEALSAVDKVFPKAALTRVKKVPAASVASDLVRNEIVLN